jgi:hypothetical protein
MPPAIHTPNKGKGPGSFLAIPAGVRKIPDPIVMPMTTATALHRPSRRGSASAGVLDSLIDWAEVRRGTLDSKSNIPRGARIVQRLEVLQAKSLHRDATHRGSASQDDAKRVDTRLQDKGISRRMKVGGAYHVAVSPWPHPGDRECALAIRDRDDRILRGDRN